MLRQELEDIVKRLADTYGSEHTGGGFVFETSATNIADAVADLNETVKDVLINHEFDAEYVNIKSALTDQKGNPATCVVTIELPFSQFRDAYYEGAHLDFMNLVESHDPSYAKVGGDDYSEKLNCPGLFYECLLVAGELGKNFLVYFPAVWT